jgi:hypothetical protein
MSSMTMSTNPLDVSLRAYPGMLPNQSDGRLRGEKMDNHTLVVRERRVESLFLEYSSKRQIFYILNP